LLGGVKLGIGLEFDGAFAPLGLGYLGTAGAFGVELLQHGRAGGLVEIDIENLGARYLDSPVIDRVLHQRLDRGDQLRAVGLDLVEIHLADLGAHDARHGGGDCAVHVADAIDRLFRLQDAIENGCFHLHQHVVAGDRVLAGIGQLAFEDRDAMRHLVEERHNQVDSGAEHLVQLAEPFNHILFGLRHDLEAARDDQKPEDRQEDPQDIGGNQFENHVFGHGGQAL